MGFGNQARRARDPALPWPHRVGGLASCVQLHRPLGFHATLDYLRVLAGPFGHDEAALLRATDALCASRDAWQVEVRAFAARRTRDKRAGRRSPPPGEAGRYATATRLRAVPLDDALRVLRFWREHRLPGILDRGGPATAAAVRYADACLAADGALVAQPPRLAVHPGEPGVGALIGVIETAVQAARQRP